MKRLLKIKLLFLLLVAIITTTNSSAKEALAAPKSTTKIVRLAHRKHFRLNIVLTQNMSYDDIQHLVYAAECWEKVTDGMVSFQFYSKMPFTRDDEEEFDEKTISVRIASDTEEFVKTVDKNLTDIFKEDAWTLGFYDKWNLQKFDINNLFIVKQRIFSSGEYHKLFLHELGHAIGLDHTKDVKSVMLPGVSDQAQCIMPVDVKQLCDTNFDCSGRKFHYCDEVESHPQYKNENYALVQY